MDWIFSIQKAIDYIENNLSEDINLDEIAGRVYSSSFHFQRIFSIITGVTISDYIRNRRLTLAGQELFGLKAKVLDVALKYGYESPESFAKAFIRFHGVTPSAAQKSNENLKIFLPFTININIQGGFNMSKEADKMFEKMFSKQPYIIDGDYYFFDPYYENASAEVKKRYEQTEKKIFQHGLSDWNERTFQDDFNSSALWMTQIYEYIDDGFSKINEIFDKIANENKPFMDISSCYGQHFGLIPFIAKINPKIPCMETGIDPYMMRALRSFFNRDLPGYNIKLAAFDNCDIPIKDNSLDYITSTFGIGCITSAETQNHWYNITEGREKPISEIYRILKPGGCFVTIESVQDWKFDLAKTKEACKHHGKLFGKYGYDEIAETQKKLTEVSWRDLFAAAGFEVETEEKYPCKARGYELRNELFSVTNIFKILEWTKKEKEQYFSSARGVNQEDFDDEAESFGIEYTQGQIFYVLRKA